MSTGRSHYSWVTVLFFFLASVFLSAPSVKAADGSCSGACGGNGGGCFCGSLCPLFGNCCKDACPQCGYCKTNSCVGNCGNQSGSCWCDSLCSYYGDCCDDACYFCGTHVDCPPVVGDVCSSVEHDCNPYVGESISTAVNRIAKYGDIMGFFIDDYPDFNHWQGLQRLPVYDSYLNGKYMVIDSDDPNRTCGSVRSHMGVVELDSRATGSGRYRSNRLVYGQDTWDVTPSTSDVVVHHQSVHSNWWHAGGMQSIGRYLLVGLEGNCSSSNAAIAMYDMYNPESPVRLNTFPMLLTGAGTAGIAKLSNGRFLLVSAGPGLDTLDFLLSNAPNVSLADAEFTFIDRWSKQGTWYEWNSINLVTDYNGELYLIATGHPDSDEESDRLGAYHLEIYEYGSPTITSVAQRTMDCTPPGERQCKFKGAAGAYVSPNHELYIYAASKYSDGPSNITKMMEFRPVPSTGSSVCTSMGNAWIEFYEHTNFDGQSIMLDWVDRAKRKTNQFSAIDDFNDKASSVKWCLPSYAYFKVYKHSYYGGGYYYFYGNGTVRADSSLHNNTFSDSSTVGDNISSGQWGP